MIDVMKNSHFGLSSSSFSQASVPLKETNSSYSGYSCIVVNLFKPGGRRTIELSLFFLSRFLSSCSTLIFFFISTIFPSRSYSDSPSLSGKVNDRFLFLTIGCYAAVLAVRSISLSKSSTCLNIFLYFLLNSLVLT